MSGERSSAEEVEALRAEVAALERQLRRQELRSRKILGASLEGFHVVGTHGELLDCNEAFAEGLGYTRDEVLAMSISQIDVRGSPDLDALTEVIQQRGAQRFAAQHRRRDGALLDVEVSVHLVEVEGARIFAAFSHPIGERLARERALRASEGKLRAVFERTGMLLALLSPEGRLVERNPRLAGLVGAPAPGDEEAAFWDMSFWASEADRRAIEGCVRAAAAGGARGCEVELRGAGGEAAVVVLQVGPLLDEEGRCAQLLAEGYEVTEQRRAEAEREAIQGRLLAAQEATIRELSTPLIPLEAGVLAVPLVGRIDRVRAAALLERLLSAVVERRAAVAILDITGVPVVDAEVAASLVQAAHAVKLLGAQAILTGVRPEVAATLVELELDLRGLVTLDSLQSGLAWARARRARR